MKRKLLCCLVLMCFAFSMIAHGDSDDGYEVAGAEKWVKDKIGNLRILWLFLIIAITLYLLGKGADMLVEEAVTLSVR